MNSTAKKSIVVLAIAALLFSTGTAFAKNGSDDQHGGFGLGFGLGLHARVNVKDDHKNDDKHDNKQTPVHQNMVIVAGTIKSIGSDNIVVTAQRGWVNGATVKDQDVTIKVDANTKYRIQKDDGKFADLKVGYSVIVKGSTTNNVNTAAWVQVHAKTKVAFGEVTAKTDGSVTVKNSVTGEVTTVAIDSNTKVMINGETKSAADIQVGDKGSVRMKGLLSTFVAKVIKLFR